MKIVSAILIYLVIFIGYLSMSGAPIRVHVGPAVGLFIGFLLPALTVRKWKEIKEKLWLILALEFTGIMALCFFSSNAISKASFIGMLIPLLPMGTVALMCLLLIHVLCLTTIGHLTKLKVEPARAGNG